MDSPVISVAVDDAEFNRFLEKFEGYKKEAGTSPDPFARAASSLNEASTAIGQLSAEFNALSKAAGTSAMTGTNSFISRWERGSHNAALDWANTAKSIDHSRKDLISFNRQWSALRTLGKGGIGIAGFLTGIAGAAGAVASDVASDNRRNRELHLQPGEVPAFNNTFKRYGLSDADIGNTLDAQQDPTKWRAFQAAGLNQQQIQGMDPAELTAYMDKWAGGKMREWQAAGLPVSNMRKAFGLDALLSTSQLNLAASYSDDEHDKSLAQFHQDIPKFAIDQKKEDEATDQQQKWDDAWTGIKRSMERAFLHLTPSLTRLGTAASNAVSAFADSPKVAYGLDLLATGLDKSVTVMNAIYSDAPLRTGHPELDKILNGDPRYPVGVTGTSDRFQDWLHARFPNSAASGNVPKSSTAPDLSQLPDSIKALSSAAEKKYGLPDGFQQMQIWMESKGRVRAVNPDTGAAGLTQLMPATAIDMGVDPFNAEQSVDAGAKLMRQFLDKWHGNLGKALASYDGDTHVGADARKFDSWIMGARQETLNQLRHAEDSGFDLNMSPSEIAFLNAHTEGMAAAKHDAKLKKPADTLDPSQFQIIDVSKEKPQPQDTSMLNTLSTFARKYLGEGGGAQFSKPQESKKSTTPSGQTAPIKVDVRVSTPAGSSTNVAVNGIPQ